VTAMIARRLGTNGPVVSAIGLGAPVQVRILRA